MKQIATILLLIFSLASITSVDSGSIFAPKPRKEHAPLTSTYEDKGRMDIADITDILHDSRLELPQSVRLQSQHQDVQQSHRRPSCNGKSADIVTLILSHHKPNKSLGSQKAVAAARHNKGYYIYTLRHIVI